MSQETLWNARIRSAAASAGIRLDADVVDELATHAAMTYDAALARGQNPREAQSAIDGLIAGWVTQPETLRRPEGRAAAPPPPPVERRRMIGLGRDVHYAVRLLARQRGFAMLAMLTMALAIAVASTVFSVVDAVLLRPLPWRDADRYIRLTETHAGATRQIPLLMTNIGYASWADNPSTIEGLGAWSTGVAAIGTGSATTRVRAARITPGTLAMLGVAPSRGGVFTADDAPEAIVSYGLWQEQFDSSTDVVGRAVQIDGQTCTLVGVMPRSFVFPDRETRLWRPLKIPAAPAMTTFSVMAKLRPGVTSEQAAAEATARARGTTVSATALMMMFGSTGAAEVSAEPALDALTHDVRPALLALFVAVSLLFLATIANIASLQLARTTTRYREIAIRSALGAGTRALIQQLVVEQVILAMAGGLLGVIASAGAHRLLPTLLPADFPRLSEIGMSPAVVLFAFALAALTGIGLGVMPALHLRRLRLTQALTESAAGSIGGTRGRARLWIMTGQVTVACTLLVGALLLARSFVAMFGQDRGFDRANLLTARLTLPQDSTPQARIDAVEEFVMRATDGPGAPILAATTGLPLSGSENISGFDMPSLRPPLGVNINAHAVRSVVTPDYVAALGLRLIAGRNFRADDDSAAAPKVVMVNRTFAKEYLTDRALGDRIRNFMTGDGVDFEVIGIVDDMRRKGLTDRVQPEIYSLLRQSPRPSAVQDLVIRTPLDPAHVAEPLRRLAKQVAPAATLESVRTMDDRILGSLARPRLYAVLLVAFAVSAVIIACVGLIGALSYSVSQRMREIALRVALGAKPTQVVGLILRQGVAVTIIGITAGMLLAYALAGYVTPLMYAVTVHDVISYGAAALALAAIALAVCLAPALRATRIDPSTMLRD